MQVNPRDLAFQPPGQAHATAGAANAPHRGERRGVLRDGASAAYDPAQETFTPTSSQVMRTTGATRHNGVAVMIRA